MAEPVFTRLRGFRHDVKDAITAEVVRMRYQVPGRIYDGDELAVEEAIAQLAWMNVLPAIFDRDWDTAHNVGVSLLGEVLG